MTLRDKLIVLRDKAGISQMTLAEQLGVSRQAISRWESGDAVPTMDKLKSLSKMYLWIGCVMKILVKYKSKRLSWRKYLVIRKKGSFGCNSYSISDVYSFNWANK